MIHFILAFILTQFKSAAIQFCTLIAIGPEKPLPEPALANLLVVLKRWLRRRSRRFLHRTVFDFDGRKINCNGMIDNFRTMMRNRHGFLTDFDSYLYFCLPHDRSSLTFWMTSHAHCRNHF